MDVNNRYLSYKFGTAQEPQTALSIPKSHVNYENNKNEQYCDNYSSYYIAEINQYDADEEQCNCYNY